MRKYPPLDDDTIYALLYRSYGFTASETREIMGTRKRVQRLTGGLTVKHRRDGTWMLTEPRRSFRDWWFGYKITLFGYVFDHKDTTDTDLTKGVWSVFPRVVVRWRTFRNVPGNWDWLDVISYRAEMVSEHNREMCDFEQTVERALKFQHFGDADIEDIMNFTQPYPVD